MNNDKNKSVLRDFSALADFSNLINSKLDIHFTLNNLALTSMGKFHSSRVAVFLKDEKGLFQLYFSKGIRDDFKRSSFKNAGDLISEMNEHFPVVMPLEGRVEEIGYYCLGKKIDNSGYTEADFRFLRTLLNITATAIENALNFDRLNSANKELDSKVNQLSSLFDLSKEFSGLMDVRTITKLLVYSLIGQLMVSDYAVVLCENGKMKILESNFPEQTLKGIFETCDFTLVKNVIKEHEFQDYLSVSNDKIKMLIPMIVKGVTRGFIILGERKNKKGYTKSDIDFISSLAGIAIISIENARLIEEVVEKEKIEKELETARKIQKSLLPQSIPEIPHFEIAAYSESAKQVGGDYYDIIELSEHKTLIAISDVSGKGVQASLLMANLQAFLKSISRMNYNLDEASNFLNDLVTENTRMGNFITFFWGVLDSENLRFTYVNAGHNPTLLVRNGEIRKLNKGGMILGVMKTAIPYISEEVQLQAGDLLVLFTDGITEAMDAEFNEYSDERLENLVLDLQEKESAEEILEKIKNDVALHIKGNTQSDDITCMVVKVK